jgi:hypothetical protein
MQNIFYTGIGSRETPEDICKMFIGYGRFLARKGYILRSGGADGADKAFEIGCDEVNGPKEIFLPWKGFNGNSSDLFQIPQECFEIARDIHPNFDNLSQGAKKLHARNVLQVLGKDLKTPSKFIVCYTKNQELKGGTRTALILAQRYNIPMLNLGCL